MPRDTPRDTLACLGIGGNIALSATALATLGVDSGGSACQWDWTKILAPEDLSKGVQTQDITEAVLGRTAVAEQELVGQGSDRVNRRRKIKPSRKKQTGTRSQLESGCIHSISILPFCPVLFVLLPLPILRINAGPNVPNFGVRQ